MLIPALRLQVTLLLACLAVTLLKLIAHGFIESSSTLKYDQSLRTLKFDQSRCSLLVPQLQVTLLLACLAATLVKLIAHGFTNFWGVVQHRVELAISLGGAAVGVFSLATPEADTATVLHVAVVLRILHVVASLKWATHLSQLVALTGQIMARSTPLMSTLAVWWYFMSCLGVFLFGGLICDPTAVPDDPSHTCNASDAARTTAYATGDYFNLNFNDFGSALVTMFTLSVVNNWQVLTEQFVVTSGTRAARWFFIVNYYIGVACVLQVLNTFIITELYEKYQFRTPPKSARTRNRIDSHDTDSECSSAESDDEVLEGIAADDAREDTPLMPPHESYGESYSESYGESYGANSLRRGFRRSASLGTRAMAVAVRRARGLRSVVRAQMRQSHQLADVAMQVLLQRHNQQTEGGAAGGGADAEQGHSMSSLLSRLRRTNDNV
eukprot:TRINITY_DN4434_c0_g1_i7.p1 TRINITY_DN4434_c0_g1~~TRINITY_DN4434_c0_g1_i7.p1  ORF type:complete len:439 (-),score=163.79 TRINITY_DN4434_c0_g1_i7:360-1676(-)